MQKLSAKTKRQMAASMVISCDLEGMTPQAAVHIGRSLLQHGKHLGEGLQEILTQFNLAEQTTITGDNRTRIMRAILHQEQTS
jgi:hypothetical protein